MSPENQNLSPAERAFETMLCVLFTVILVSFVMLAFHIHIHIH